eukprot:4357536-Heterocapsa_arctica.AAC.1
MRYSKRELDNYEVELFKECKKRLENVEMEPNMYIRLANGEKHNKWLEKQKQHWQDMPEATDRYGN